MLLLQLGKDNSTLENQTGSIISEFDALNSTSPLQFASANLVKPEATQLYSRASPELLERAATDVLPPIVFEDHSRGVSPEAFRGNAYLGNESAYTLITTSPDRNGSLYLSSFEAVGLPISGTQFHPEKPAFEWSPSFAVPHTREAIALAQAVSNSFLDAARRSYDARAAPPGGDVEMDLVITNYAPQFTADWDTTASDDPSLRRHVLLQSVEMRERPMAVRRGLDFLRVNEKRHVACSSKWYHTPLSNDYVKLLKNLHLQVHDESLTFKICARSSIRAPPRVLPSYFEATSRGTWYHRATTPRTRGVQRRPWPQPARARAPRNPGPARRSAAAEPRPRPW